MLHYHNYFTVSIRAPYLNPKPSLSSNLKHLVNPFSHHSLCLSVSLLFYTKMSGIRIGNLTLTHVVFFLLFLLALSSTFETCYAGRGHHWRHRRAASASLVKKKVKTSHGQHHHGGVIRATPKKKAPLPKEVGQPSLPPPQKGYNSGIPSSTFSVMDFGAKGDGKSDDTKSFEAAWAAACKVEASTINVPSGYTFLVRPISFSGPYCARNIVFQLDGTIIAPTNSQAWGSGLFQWILFSKLNGITIRGKGTMDGRGSVWWQDSPYIGDNDSLLSVPLNNTGKYAPMPIDSKLGGKMPSIKPTALRFYGSFNVTVTGITIQNSPQCHLKFDNCIGVSVFEMSVSSPGDSLNTDGIHLQNSGQVNIHHTNLACGDDCISIQTGCSNVFIHDVNCGPGHGISIGGLGKDNTKACVSNITVRDIKMHNTMNGVRIKTWQGGFGSVQGVMFSNIQVFEVELPIVIDQYYCDKMKCKNQTSAVALSGITFEKIIGTYTVKPVHLACSDSLPCIDVTLSTIQLKPLQERYHMYDPFCWQTFGELSTPTVPPIACLQIGKPAKNRIHSDQDTC